MASKEEGLKEERKGRKSWMDGWRDEYNINGRISTSNVGMVILNKK